MLYTVFSVLQGCHAVFLFELPHEVVLVFVAALTGIYVGDSAMLVFKSKDRYICLSDVVKYPVNEPVISETVSGKNKPVQTALADERVNILNALGVVVPFFI